MLLSFQASPPVPPLMLCMRSAYFTRYLLQNVHLVTNANQNNVNIDDAIVCA